MGKIQAIAPREVCDFLKQAQEEGHDLSSIESTIKLARSEKKPKVAAWIKKNPLAYGVGYWNGFIPEDITVEQGEPEGEPAKNNLPESIAENIIENSKKVQEHAENIKTELAEKPKRTRRRIPPEEDKND
jgi:hypothetical protein